MADYPDIYADGFMVAANAAGLTITLTLTDPSLKPGASQPPAHAVARVRMSAWLAEDMAKIITQAISQAKTGPVQQVSQTKH